MQEFDSADLQRSANDDGIEAESDSGCNDPTHDVECCCGATPVVDYERGLGL